MQELHCCIATSNVAPHTNRFILRVPGRNNLFSAATGERQRRSLAVIQNLISYAQDRIAKRRQYNRLADEIASLSSRDLADLRADRGEMLRHAYKKIYG
jgi:ribosomal protein S7